MKLFHPLQKKSEPICTRAVQPVQLGSHPFVPLQSSWPMVFCVFTSVSPDLDSLSEQGVQNRDDRQMLLLDAMKSKTLRGEPNVLDT